MSALENVNQHVPELLFVDDEADFLQYVSRNLKSFGYEVHTCRFWPEARKLLDRSEIHPEIIFFEPLTGEQTENGGVSIQDVCSTVHNVPVVVLTSSMEPRRIVSAIHEGASDYICKPFTLKELNKVIHGLLEGKGTTEKPSRSKPLEKIEFIYCSSRLEQVNNTIQQISHTKVPVLITGESGVGKDIVARLIHQNSTLQAQPFVKVNCAAMPSELVESELFGYQKGAFTGAFIDKPGKFEFANGGTIFLDEIGEFPSSVQAKLLQVLQDGRFTRLGSNRELEVDVRVIAATNRKLDEAIKKQTFREDLFYRLNVVNIEIAPLRHRKEDVELLTQHFIQKFSALYDGDIKELPPELKTLFQMYNWPGNVRELENLIKRYIVLQDADSIQRELESKITRENLDQVGDMAEEYLQQEDSDGLDLKEITKKAASVVEKNMIVKALHRTKWNKWRAAKELKVSYKTLLTKIDLYQIEPGK